MKISKNALILIISGAVTFMFINALAGIFPNTEDLNETSEYRIQRVFEVDSGQSVLAKRLIESKFQESGFLCYDKTEKITMCSDDPKSKVRSMVGLSYTRGKDQAYVTMIIQHVDYREKGDPKMKKIPESKMEQFLRITNMFETIIEG